MAVRVIIAGKSSLADVLSAKELTEPVRPVRAGVVGVARVRSAAQQRRPQLLKGTLGISKDDVESFMECAICRGVMREPVMIKQVRRAGQGSWRSGATACRTPSPAVPAPFLQGVLGAEPADSEERVPPVPHPHPLSAFPGAGRAV